MTARQVYEAVLIELNKAQAPSLLLEDFNYLFNKSIYQYINKRYNIYDTNQQTTDDVRVLKATTVLEPVVTPEDRAAISAEGPNFSRNVISKNSLYGATYEFNLPADYLHLLNCVVNYSVEKTYKCYDRGTYWQTGAIRLTADIWPQIINNFYMKPSYRRPYYYIHNVNTSTVNPTNPVTTDNNSRTSINISGTDVNQDTTLSRDNNNTPLTGSDNSIIINNPNLPRFLNLGNTNKQDDVVERSAGHRYGNASNVRLEVRYGKDDSVFKLVNVWIDYIKAPQHIRLTQEQIDLVEDTSQIMEFPDYVCQEIINELVHIVMENASDPRLQSHPVVSQSIASPAQEQTQSRKK